MIVKKPHMLLPAKGVDLFKWSVIACDQFTSEPEYWQELEETVGGEKSTLSLIYPEDTWEKRAAGAKKYAPPCANICKRGSLSPMRDISSSTALAATASTAWG